MYEKKIDIIEKFYDDLKYIEFFYHVESQIQLLKYTIQCNLYQRKDFSNVINYYKAKALGSRSRY
mgnify:CR=1